MILTSLRSSLFVVVQSTCILLSLIAFPSGCVSIIIIPPYAGHKPPIRLSVSIDFVLVRTTWWWHHLSARSGFPQLRLLVHGLHSTILGVQRLFPILASPAKFHVRLTTYSRTLMTPVVPRTCLFLILPLEVKRNVYLPIRLRITWSFNAIVTVKVNVAAPYVIIRSTHWPYIGF